MMRRALLTLTPKANATIVRRAVRTTSAFHTKSSDMDPSVPQFVVGVNNGFLPRDEPLAKLPERFAALDELLHKMPKVRKDGKPGLLAVEGQLVPESQKVPEYDVSDINDTALLTALFRDYTFWASAYLLEPCDFQFQKDKTYGLGRSVLPRNIAVPMAAVSKKIGASPFMEYAQSYALFNWKRIDTNKPLAYENMELIRSFEGSTHEAGFILVHVAMVANSGDQVRYSLDVMNAVEKKDRESFNIAMEKYILTMQKINQVMETMWNRSSSAAYNSFRSYIMGTKNQPMFPNGVIYEGVSTEPTFFRGESGANDTIIPTCDNLLQITDRMPSNPLTETLRDFRQYRPVKHNEWLSYVGERASHLNLAKFAQQDANSAVRYLAAIDQVREFRDRHWRFTKEYIIKYSDHPVATGGSPIITWLPNQLSTVLKMMVDVSKNINKSELDSEMHKLNETLSERADRQERVLRREVEELKKKFPNQ